MFRGKEDMGLCESKLEAGSETDNRRVEAQLRVRHPSQLILVPIRIHQTSLELHGMSSVLATILKSTMVVMHTPQ